MQVSFELFCFHTAHFQNYLHNCKHYSFARLNCTTVIYESCFLKMLLEHAPTRFFFAKLNQNTFCEISVDRRLSIVGYNCPCEGTVFLHFVRNSVQADRRTAAYVSRVCAHVPQYAYARVLECMLIVFVSVHLFICPNAHTCKLRGYHRQSCGELKGRLKVSHVLEVAWLSRNPAKMH